MDMCEISISMEFYFRCFISGEEQSRKRKMSRLISAIFVYDSDLLQVRAGT